MKRANTRISVLLKEQLDQKLWYERLNLVNKFKRMCQWCTGNFSFWVAVGAFSSVEPILCSYRPVGIIFLAQLAVLTASSILYVIQLVGCASREWDKIVMIQAMSSSRTIITVQDFTPFKVFIFFSAEGEYILEFCCLLGGWLTIFIRPGLAVLRCFRVFRLLWFYEVVVFKTTVEDLFDPVFGAEFVARCFKVLKFSINALTALGNEMFRLTNATRGGLLLMLMFFYSAFVLGTTLWIETNSESEFCLTKSGCVYTLMRLTFYDGTGFDFTYSLLRNHTFLFFLCIAYMCVTSFGLLNGLVGIFGTLFQTASDEAFNEEADGSSSDSQSGSGSDSENENDAPDGGGQDGQDEYAKRKLRTHRLASLVFRSHRNLDCSDGEGGGSEAGGLHTSRGGAIGFINAVPFSYMDHHKDHQSPKPSPRASPRADSRSLGGGGSALADRTRAQHQHASDDDGSLVGPHGEGEGEGDAEVWAYGSDDEGPGPVRANAQPGSTTAGGGGGSAGAEAIGDPKRRRSLGHAGVPPPMSRDSSKRDSSSSKQQEAALAAALAKNQYGSFSVAEKAEVQRRLAGKIGGASHFALMELKKMAAAESQSPPIGHHRKAHSSHHSLHDARRGEAQHRYQAPQGHQGHQGHFDQGKVYPAGAGIADLPDHSNDAPTTSAERRAHHHNGSTSGGHGYGNGHAHSNGHTGHRGHGMFGQMRRHNSHRSMGAHSTDHRPNPFAPKATHSHGHGSQSHSHTHGHGHGHAPAVPKDNTAEIKALSQQVQTLSRTVEVQNDMIIALFSQIQQSLRQQQQHQHQTQHTQHAQGNSDKSATDKTSEKTKPEAEILFPEMAPSRNMAENVARFLPAVTPIHPNAHAKPLPSSNLSSAAHTVLAAIPPRSTPSAPAAHMSSVPQGHAQEQEHNKTPGQTQSGEHILNHSLHIEPIDAVSPHKHGLEAIKSDSTPNSPFTPATRSSTSTTSAEMSAFSLLAPELKNK